MVYERAICMPNLEQLLPRSAFFLVITNVHSAYITAWCPSTSKSGGGLDLVYLHRDYEGSSGKMNVALSALMGTVFGTRLPVIAKISE